MKPVKFFYLFLILNHQMVYSIDNCTIDFKNEIYPVTCKEEGFEKENKKVKNLIEEVIPHAPQAIFEAVNVIKEEFSADIYNRYKKELDIRYFLTVGFGTYAMTLGSSHCPSIACFKATEHKVLIELEITEDIYKDLNKFDIMSMLCHEIGHGIAGGETFNKKNSGTFERNNPSYVEGEADYFIPKCMKRLIEKGHIKLDEYNFINTIDNDVMSVCNMDDQCKLILQSSKNFSREILERRNKFFGGFVEEANYKWILKKSLEEPSYLKSDKKRVLLKTSHLHPNFQCRFDTVKNAYFEIGRPRCWSANLTK